MAVDCRNALKLIFRALNHHKIENLSEGLPLKFIAEAFGAKKPGYKIFGDRDSF